jgi:hypothetical protein
MHGSMDIKKCNVTTHKLQVCAIDVVVECCRFMALCVLELQNSLCYLVRAKHMFRGNHFVFYVFFFLALFSLEFQILYFIICY